MFKMDELPSRPSVLLKIFSVTVHWSFRLLLAAWVLFAITWASLYLFIVPRIGELRPQIEARATSLLGVSLKIGAITSRDDGLIPSFELNDVRLFAPDGSQVLHLPQIIASVSPRSLWRLGFEQIYIERPQLHVRRTVDGRIFVAGLDFSQNQGVNDQAGDWFFSQTEFVIRDGLIEWTDDLRAQPALTLEHVDLVVRNRLRSHALRLDATPPASSGQRFSVVAQFRQPLLSSHAGRWRTWDGQVHALFEQVNLPQLRQHVDLGVDVLQGQGALRAWVDVKRGQVSGATADVALSDVRVRSGAAHDALAFSSLAGRLGAKVQPGGFEFSTQSLQFETGDGRRWPGGNARVVYRNGTAGAPARTELQADQLDLAAMSRLAELLPTDPRVQAMLTRYAPKGLVERIDASWLGPVDAPELIALRGRVTGLEVVAQAKGEAPSPGVRGADIGFDMTHEGGRASITLQDGRLELPGLFDDPVLNLSQLSTDVQWKREGDRLTVQLPNLKFSHADARGDLQLKWQTGEVRDAAGAHGPGVLDLQGSLAQVDLRQVARYWPAGTARQVQAYLGGALVQGQARSMKFRVKGDLRHFPFIDPRQGEFRVSAAVRDATFAYVPRSSQSAGDLPWPALTHFNGDLLIDRASLQLKGVSARVAGGLRIFRAEGGINNLMDKPVVTVSAEANGPLADLLGGVLRGSPLTEMTDRVLAQASGTGQAQYQFRLALPLDALEKSTVQGKVTLAGNDLQIAPDIPRLSRLRGVIHFSENGFFVSAGQARALGGDVRIEGGTMHLPGSAAVRSNAPPVLRANGMFTAEGLRQAQELGVSARLAQQAGGSAAYTLVLGVRQDNVEIQVDSTLQGLSLNLPAPLNKSAEAALPLRFEIRGLPAGSGVQGGHHDQLSLSLGQVAAARYVREVSKAETRVVRGSVGVGLEAGEEVPMPLRGVVANARFDRVDLDAWRTILSPAPGLQAFPGRDNPVPEAASMYLPDSVALRARELVIEGRQIKQVVAGGSRDGNTWRANLDAQELSGYVEYRPSTPVISGRVYARLARLALGPSMAREVESLLEDQPAGIPALDIVIGDMELRGKRLGRVEVEALNRGAREWRLNRLNVTMPEAVFTATGNWAYAGDSLTAPRTPLERRRTNMGFKLDIHDAGALLGRLDMKDVIRKGQGKMEGQVSWAGSPLAMDYPTLGGAFSVNVESGQFLKAEPGIAKLLGVLSLQSLPRRLALDFRDVFSDGFSFDFVRGDVHIDQGLAMTNNLQMKGVNAAVLMEGRADIARETQDLRVVVVPEINAGTASLLAAWINPAVGLGSFLAQMFLRLPLIESATQEFHIDGNWSDPRVTRVDASPAGKTGAPR